MNSINTVTPNLASTPRINPDSPQAPGYLSNGPVVQVARDMASTVGQVGREQRAQRNFETNREDRQGEMERNRQDKAMEQILRDPKNADYYSKQYGIPMTPELQALLAEPEKAQMLADAYKMANDTGIKNPEAKKIFVQKYIETNGNMVEAANAVGGMDTREPMSVYQEKSLDLQRQRLNKTGAGKKPPRVPLTFGKQMQPLMEQMMGVEYTNPKKPEEGTAEGSTMPLQGPDMQKVLARAAEIYQQTGDPYQAAEQALSEFEFEDVAAQDNWDWWGLGTPDVPAHRRIKTTPPAPGAAAPAAPAAQAPVKSAPPPPPAAKPAPQATAPAGKSKYGAMWGD